MGRYNKNLIKDAILNYKLIIPNKIYSQYSIYNEDNDINLKTIKEKILIELEDRERAIFKPVFKVLIVAIITISILITCIACVESIRNFVIDFFDISIDIHDNDSNINDIKKEFIEEVYLPSSVSNTYDIVLEDYSTAGTFICWMHEVDNIVLQQIPRSESEISLDNEEEGIYEFQNIGNVEVFYTLTNNYYNIVWKQYGYLFIFSCPDSLSWEWIEEAITSLEIVDVEIQTNN